MACRTKPFTIFIEGNIGAGKSTLLKYFERADYIETVPEPIEKWQNLKNSNLLEMMYNNPQKYSFPFQSYTILLMLQNQMKKTTKPVKMLERSLLSAQYCFNEILKSRNNLNKEEYDILNEWNKFIAINFNVQPDLVIHLRTAPENVFARIKQRARAGENNISLEYLQHMHELHENWLADKKKFPFPILLLNGDLNEDDIKAEYEKKFENISDDIIVGK